jgi:RimJ/RimL family protein N-acetyltransferase
MTRLPHPYGVEDALFFLREIAPTEVAWAETSERDSVLLGIAGLVPHEGGSVELGYWLGRAHWGNGVATEAAGAIVRYADDVFGLDVIISGCFSDNLASASVLRKLGFVETGRSTRACLALGLELPFIDMSVHGTR